MERNSMNVLDLLDLLSQIVNEAPGVPLTGKVMVDAGELLGIYEEIKLKLPRDLKEAKFVNAEKERILSDATNEFDKIVLNAKKQASCLVEENEITKRSKERANEIIREAEDYTYVLKMKTYDYVDNILFDMQGRMDELNMKYCGEMYNTLEKTFNDIGHILQDNRDEIKTMAVKTKEGEEVSL